MNDLLAPILIQMEDEVDSFWCFQGFMEVMYPNFHKDQTGMQSQLNKLEKLVQLMDPPLHQCLLASESNTMFFCYRWILVLFKREISLHQTYLLWEVLWSNHYHKEFHLFVALAALHKYREQLMQQVGFDNVLKFVTTLEEPLDVGELLEIGTSLYLNFERTTDEEVKLSIFGN